MGGDSFTYTVSSTAGLVSNIGTVWIVVGPTGSLLGYSYVDQNNNGVKDSNDAGIAGVSVTVQKTDGNFTFSQSVQTQSDGSYVFNNLPSGVYTITETQPAFFEHGKETAGTPVPAASASGQFAGITLTGSATSTESGSGFNFAELGLRAQFVSAYLTSRAFFASSVSTLSGFNASTGDVWMSFDAGIAGILNAAVSAGGSGNVSLTLYDNNLQPLVTTATSTTSAQLTYQGTAGQPYFLEMVGTSANANLQTSIVNTDYHNDANPLDVYDDGDVTPQDALAVISLLNTIGSGPLAGKQVPAGLMPDVLGNGILSPQDALQIINYLSINPVAPPLDVAPDVSAASSPAVTPAVTAAVPQSAEVEPAVTSPLAATTNTSSPQATSAAAAAIPPATVAAPAASAESAAPLSSTAAPQSSATQPATATQSTIARTQFFASSAPPAAPPKPASTSVRQMDPAAVAMVMSLNSGPWDTL